MQIRAAFGFSRARAVTVLGFVNGVRIPGGQHVDALRAAVAHAWPQLNRGWVGVIALEMHIDRVSSKARPGRCSPFEGSATAFAKRSFKPS